MVTLPVKWMLPARISCNLDPDLMPHSYSVRTLLCILRWSWLWKEGITKGSSIDARTPSRLVSRSPPHSTPPHHLNCSHNPQLVGDDNCRRPINYYCLHINYKHHVWQWGKWDLVTNFMRLGCPAAFLNMLQIAIPYLASVMGSYG